MYRHMKASVDKASLNLDKGTNAASEKSSQEASSVEAIKSDSSLPTQTYEKLSVKEIDEKIPEFLQKSKQIKISSSDDQSSDTQQEHIEIKKHPPSNSASSATTEKHLIKKNPQSSKSVSEKQSVHPEQSANRRPSSNIRDKISNQRFDNKNDIQMLHHNEPSSAQVPDDMNAQSVPIQSSRNILTPQPVLNPQAKITTSQITPSLLPAPPVTLLPPPPAPLLPPQLAPLLPPQPPVIQEGSSNDVASSSQKDPFTLFGKDYVQGMPKIHFGQSDLLNQKRNLKKVDRLTEYHPVTLARKELFEDEYLKQGDSPPEYLPLHIVKPAIVSQNISADLVTLNLNGIDQLTDYLFPLLHGGGSTPVGNYSKLKKLLLVGCVNLTDQGLIWIGRMFPELQMIEINACRKVTEKGFHHIFMGCRNLQNFIAMAVNASLIPDSIMQTKIPTGSLQFAGSPIITQGKEYYNAFHGTDSDSYFELNKRKLLIIRDKSVIDEIIPLMTKNESMRNKLFHYQNTFIVSENNVNASDVTFNMFEISANSPIQDSLVSEGTIVMIPYSLKGVSDDDLIETGNRITEIMAAIVIKCPDVVFLLVEISTTGIKSSVNEVIKARLEYLTEALYTTTYKLYTRSWHLENLDFKGQQGLGWGITSYEALDNLVKSDETRMTTVYVTKENFNKEVMVALSKCAIDIKKYVPWVHCEWSKELQTIIDKIPKSAAKSQTSIFHETDKEARDLKHKRYSFSRLGKLINLLQNWGESLYFWHEHKSLCITDIQAYESLLIKLLSNKPTDRVNIAFLGGEIPCWKLSTIELVVETEKLEVKATDIVALLKCQGLVLPVSCHHTEEISASYLLVRMEDVPDSHEILKTLWPEPCPKAMIIQTDRCYNFLPTLPPGFMPKLLRTLVKVYQPLYVWKTGFLLRQGPVDIKASLHRYKGSTLDKTPVLLLSARVVILQTSSSSDGLQSTHEHRNVMCSCLRQVMTLVDFVCQKTKVYSCITLPCPECAEFTTEGIINIKNTWHIPYYIGLSGKHRSCKKHRTVNAASLCNLQDDKGEGHGPLIPLHNYPYNITTSAIIDEAIKSDRHRPMDPAERCFYCSSCVDVPCLHCLMCSHCTKQFAKFAKVVEPGQVTSKSFKLQLLKDGELTDDERIISNTKGCVYHYKKGYSMQLHQAMSPFYWDELFITFLKGASFFLHMTFGPGKKLEYHGHAATVIDQKGQPHQNELWKSRDANLVCIRLESVEIGKRVRVVIYLRGLEIHSEEIDGWQMKLDINSERVKPGVYIIHAPGLKATWYMNDYFFTAGSTLEVAENKHTIHPAIIVEKSLEGYLTLDMNGVQRQYIFNSPQLMPSGTAVAMGSTLASTLSSGLNVLNIFIILEHIPVRKKITFVIGHPE